MIEGSLEVKLPTIWTDGKEEVGREEKPRSEKIREEKEREERRWRRKKMQMREKVGKCRDPLCFSMIGGSGGSKRCGASLPDER